MEFMQSKAITISTLSPIHIGCDEDYVPTNFVIKDGLLHVLDMAVIADELSNDERAKLGSFQSIGAIQQFFKSKRERFAPLASRLVEVATDIANEFEEKAGKPTQQGVGGAPTYNLFPIARTAYNPVDSAPYLPGSSLKGSMRTAWLDAVNKGNPMQGKEDNRALQQRLLGYTDGKFENDPLRHLLVADAHHPENGEPPASYVLYAVSKKKCPSERSSSELKVFLETVHGLLDDAFAGEIRFTGNDINWERLCAACNEFYFPQFQAELEHPHLSPMLDTAWRTLMTDLLGDELEKLRKSNQGFLLRVGKHSGAESVTLNGMRNIKILGKKDKPPSYRPETTEKRFASQTKKSDGGLLPFGWIWVECCDDRFQHISRSMRDKLRPHATVIRQAQRDRMQQLEEAIQHRKLAKELAEQQRLAAEAQAREAEAAEAARQAKLAAMSPNLRRVEEFRAHCQRRFEQLRGNKESANAVIHTQARDLAKAAYEGTGWTAEEKRIAADTIEEWLPKVVNIVIKEEKKKLNLAALRGSA